MKKLLSVLLCAALLMLLCSAASADSAEWTGKTYLDGVQITQWDEGPVRNLVIPASVLGKAKAGISIGQDYPVRALASNILSSENAAAVVTVTLPASL